MQSAINITSVILSLIFSAQVSGAENASAREYIGTCIASFCFSDSQPGVSSKSVLDTYGPGFNFSSVAGSPTCYFDSNQKLFVKFIPQEEHRKRAIPIFGDIELSAEAICPQRKNPKKAFPPLVTKEGIKIGDTRERVIQAYGFPRSEHFKYEGLSSNDGEDSIISYFADLKGISFSLEHGRVVSKIRVHYGE